MVVNKGTKLGIHSFGPDAMEQVKEAKAQGVTLPLIKGVGDVDWLIDAKREMPLAMTMARFEPTDEISGGHETEGLEGIATATDFTAYLYHVFIYIVLKLALRPELIDAVDVWELSNEADPPGAAGWANMGRFFIEAIEVGANFGRYIYLLADRGYPAAYRALAALENAGVDVENLSIRVGFGSTNVGTPEFDELQAFVKTGVFGVAKRHDAVYCIHEGTMAALDDPIGDWYGHAIPATAEAVAYVQAVEDKKMTLGELLALEDCPVVQVNAEGGLTHYPNYGAVVPVSADSYSADDTELRYRYVAALLAERKAATGIDEQCEVACTEFYCGYRRDFDFITNQLEWYDEQVAQDWYFVGYTPFSLATRVAQGWKKQEYGWAYPAWIDYAASVRERENAQRPDSAESGPPPIEEQQMNRDDYLRQIAQQHPSFVKWINSEPKPAIRREIDDAKMAVQSGEMYATFGDDRFVLGVGRTPGSETDDATIFAFDTDSGFQSADKLRIPMYVEQMPPPLPFDALVLLMVNALSQNDPLWANLPLGKHRTKGPVTFGQWACIQTCMAMLANFWRLDGRTDWTPVTIVERLRKTGGMNGPYVGDMALARAFPQQIINGGWVSLKTGDVEMRVREMLDAGVPCIVRLDFRPNTPARWEDQHYAVAVGYTATDFIIVDPYTGKTELVTENYDIAGTDVLEVQVYQHRPTPPAVVIDPSIIGRPTGVLFSKHRPARGFPLAAMREDGYQIGYVLSSFGNKADPTFKENCNLLREAGWLLKPVHYTHPRDSAESQAVTYSNQLAKFIWDLEPEVDIEQNLGLNLPLPSYEMVSSFFDELRSRIPVGMALDIYCAQNYDGVSTTETFGCGLHLANWHNVPPHKVTPKAWEAMPSKLMMLQPTDQHRVAGYGANVTLEVWVGLTDVEVHSAEFKRLAYGDKSETVSDLTDMTPFIVADAGHSHNLRSYNADGDENNETVLVEVLEPEPWQQAKWRLWKNNSYQLHWIADWHGEPHVWQGEDGSMGDGRCYTVFIQLDDGTWIEGSPIYPLSLPLRQRWVNDRTHWVQVYRLNGTLLHGQENHVGEATNSAELLDVAPLMTFDAGERPLEVGPVAQLKRGQETDLYPLGMALGGWLREHHDPATPLQSGLSEIHPPYSRSAPTGKALPALHPPNHITVTDAPDVAMFARKPKRAVWPIKKA